MTSQSQPSKTLNVVLWTAQILLALFFMSGTVMKFMPIQKISAIMPWMGQLPPLEVRLLGVVDLLGALGLILPAALKIRPMLTPWAAIGIIVLMICATIFHISRGEASVIGVNIVVIIVAIFIAWGRFKKVPLSF